MSTIIGYWELQQFEDNKILAETARRLVSKIDEHPFLREDIFDISQLDEVRDIVDLIMSAVVPPAVSSDQIIGIFRPFTLDYFFATGPFKDLVEKAGSLPNMVKDLSPEELERKKTVAAYQSILHQLYGVELPDERQMVLTLEEPEGTNKYFHVFFDPRFCQVRAVGEIPELSREELSLLVQDRNNLELWLEKLPPENFEFTGFAIYMMREATHMETVNNIKELLQTNDTPGEEFLKLLRNQFRDMVGVPDLKIGISSYHTFKNSYHQCEEGGSMSLLVDGKKNFLKAFHDISEDLRKGDEAIIISDTASSKYFAKSKPDYLSLILIPLYSEGDFIGHLELGSTHQKLGALDYAKVSEVIPLFATALAKRMEELENAIQSTIKEHYTSIHPSVEWKFTEAAYKILEQENEGNTEVHEEIVFKDVVPLYGSSDIRNSSVIRNAAIVSDLTDQLGMAKETLQYAEARINFPIIGETLYRINKQLRKLKKGLLSGDENLIVNFLHREVEPTLKDLESDVPGFSEESRAKYWNKLDPELGIYYHKRKAFEESLTQINEAISTLLEGEEDRAQNIFPHYFEKYKTDGVEYNIYVGDAISRNKKFSNLYLRNLRLWQLLVTVEIARKTTEMKDELAQPLEAGHLILVHSQPLSIKFRMDEKQFDVDGAYNIRYEILKKRIDKVHIKDSQERLTQPNTISIIYNQEEEAREYLAYLEYLRHQGYIAQHFEQFELEELQGVSGLKAFRVKVEKSSKGLMKELVNLGVKDSAIAS